MAGEPPTPRSGRTTPTDDSVAARPEMVRPEMARPEMAWPATAPAGSVAGNGPAADIAALLHRVRLGEGAEARPALAAWVRQRPADPRGWHGLGGLAVGLGGVTAGRAALDRARALAAGTARGVDAPDGLAAVTADAGMAALLDGDCAAAAAWFEQALVAVPDSVGGRRGLARVWADAGRLAEAASLLAAAAGPADRGLLLDRLILAMQQDDWDGATALARHLPRSRYVDDGSLLVLAPADRGDSDRNIRLVPPADLAAFAPDGPDAAAIDRLRRDRRPAEIARWLDGSAASPQDRFARADALAQSGRVAEAMALMEAAWPAVAANRRAASNLLLTSLFDPARPALIGRSALLCGFDAPALPALPAVAAAPRARLRVGFVCADFRAHSNAAGIRALFESDGPCPIDRIGYHTDDHCDDTTDWFRARADGWCPAAALSDAALAARIRADRIDILVDLAGHTAGNRLGCFGRRPAPLQLSWINATGLGCLDGVLTDAGMYPPDVKFPGEPPVRLPLGALPYRPGAALPPPAGPDPAAAAVLFGCFNNPLKLSEPLLDGWAAILHTVPAGRLLLKFGSLDDPVLRIDLIQRLRARGIAPARVGLAGLTPWPDHLRALSRVDVALDPFPGNGGITSWETLCMGVPLVCLRGDRPNGRVSASILDSLGCGGTVAADPAGYVATAVHLARSAADRHRIGAAVRAAALASPLTRDGGYIGQVVAALQRLWQRSAGGGRVA